MKLGIEGRTAVVLGATSGIGSAIADALAAEGVNLIVVGRDIERAASRAAQLPEATPVAADLSDPEAVATIVTAAEQDYGQVDIVVLNGGGPAPGTATDLTTTAVGRAVDLLVQPHVDLVQRVLPGMRERGWGRILAVGSSGVHQPLPNLAASNLGRAALAGYLKTLANEVAAEGVTVNMVLPGRIQTDRVNQLDQAAAERSGRTVEEVRTASMASIPVGRYGRAEEFGAVAAFLAGESAGYVTGQEIRVDGGLIRAR